MIKTTLFLAIAATFMIGTSMSFVVSDFEAEAAKDEVKPIVNSLGNISNQLQKLDAKLTSTVAGIPVSLTTEQGFALQFPLDEIAATAASIRQTAIDARP